MSGSPARIAALLFGSGFCALIYQVAWLRELRLVFGASTPASAAVLAVFMGGLGIGSMILGKRAETARRPLLLYGNLELGIALTSALTPALLIAARAIYVAAGGTMTLGGVLGTVVRLVLSALVLLPPTVLMGGTLPAAARAAIPEDDVGRRSTALLYGANALGAVAGASVTTFLLLELFGTRLALWLGCTINLLVAIVARVMSRSMAEIPSASAATADTAVDDERASTERRLLMTFVLAASAATGFVFMLLELVWYRMLSPLLGGSTYTFGLILTIALLGIGLGGVAYTLRRPSQAPTLDSFALSCALEALFIAVPVGLGDRIAMLALLLRPLGVWGLSGLALGWSVVAAIVVLPAAVVAGYQFPLLIALLGRGRLEVGRQVGLAYATNTLGAIAGSLSGGFFLLPWITAPGAWKLAAWVLVVMAALALGLQWRLRMRTSAWRRSLVVAVGAGLATVANLHLTTGPTAVWRHSPIGAGRTDFVARSSAHNDVRQWMNDQRIAITWERDGRESSVALSTANDIAFLVNGKSDGAAVDDAPTQVMSGLLASLVHGAPKRALVIGLGTGSTAGWLAAIPDMSHVDVVEIEPTILEVARACHAVNHGVLDNPKVRVILGDAREVLLTTRDRYDIIFSEPSNPYRAGIASLFTQEFYQAVRSRLEPGGVFVQWLQAYEIDAPTVRTVYATLDTVFPWVETWRGDFTDLLLLATESEPSHDVAALRALVETEPYRTALAAAWRVNDLEGVLSHYVADVGFAKQVARHADPNAINTDDLNLLEFGIARALGNSGGVDITALRNLIATTGRDKPPLTGGDVDWVRVDESFMEHGMVNNQPTPTTLPNMSETMRHRFNALKFWSESDMVKARKAWEKLAREPRTLTELMVVADVYALAADAGKCEPILARLAAWFPAEARAIRSRLLWSMGKYDDAFDEASAALTEYRSDPWPTNTVMSSALALALEAVKQDKRHADALFELLGEPFSSEGLRVQRQSARLDAALLMGRPEGCVEALTPFEPYPIWNEDFLKQRLRCYTVANHQKKDDAAADLLSFYVDGSPSTETILPSPETTATTAASASASATATAEPASD